MLAKARVERAQFVWAGRCLGFGMDAPTIEPDGDAPPPHTLVDMLERVSALGAENDKVSLGAMLAVIGRRAYCPLLLVIGLISISPLTAAPGATWLAATITLALSVQMALGAPHPWLPGGALAARIPGGTLRAAATAAMPWARRIDIALRPRLTWLVDPPFVFVTALACAAAALITFPLGLIPLAPLAPGSAICLFGLALMTRDGLVASLAWGCLGAIGWLAFAAV